MFSNYFSVSTCTPIHVRTFCSVDQSRVVALQKLWMYLTSVVSGGVFRWSLVITRLGKPGNSEIRGIISVNSVSSMEHPHPTPQHTIRLNYLAGFNNCRLVTNNHTRLGGMNFTAWPLPVSLAQLHNESDLVTYENFISTS